MLTMMMRSNQTKLTPPPPVPPRPSKTVVAEALAKSRRISPVRALYATQPLSAVDKIEKSLDIQKPVVPIRTAPPPPMVKPKPGGQIAQPQVVKSNSSALVFNPKLKNVEELKIARSMSDCGDEFVTNKSRTVVYQSSNIKTSKIEVNLVRKPSTKTNGLKRVESTKNERNKDNSTNSTIEDKQTIKVTHCVKINTNDDLSEDNSKSELADTIVQSSEKTMIIVTNKPDDANNNIFAKKDLIQDEYSDSSNEKGSKDSTSERNLRKVQFDDKINHEILIAELQSMKEEQERLSKRQRKPPVDIYDDNESVSSDRSGRIHHSDWVEVANNGEEVRLSSCQIYIDPIIEDVKSKPIISRMSSLHGLPPLPKSLSGFNLVEASHQRGSYPQTPNRGAGSSRGPTPPTPAYSPHPRLNGTTELPRARKVTTLDTQLAILRREMYGLRQLDLSLLSQLYSLNESIQDFRQMLQDQEDSALSPHSPSPSPSSGDEADEFYSPGPVRFKAAPLAPPLRRTSNSSSANSSEYGTV